MGDVTAGLVLVVDDAIVVRTVVRHELEAHGYVVVEAADGDEAMQRLRDERPDAVLLDIEMPGADGYAVLAAIQADADVCETPVVFLTGRHESEELASAMQAGAHDYLRKPVDEIELVARVRSAVRIKRLQDQLRASNAELDQISRTDWLTGLPNRRHIEEHLASLASAALRHDQPLSVLLADVDHFKAVNDTLGHAVGDRVLHEVAQRLRLGVRSEDVIGRWGGEEFVLALPHTPMEKATVMAHRLLSVVADTPIEGRRVTVSIGVAPITTSVAETVARADDALYAAKAAGRNAVRTASPAS